MKRRASLVLILALVPVLMASGPSGRAAPRRWALIIGISDYMNLGPDGQLPGAQHDARVMRDVLVERWGFPPDHVRLLLNRKATRAAIKDDLTKWLPSVARPGDQVTVFFAGHGSQVWDGPPTPAHPHVVDGDEDDGLDETLAPTDVRLEDPSHDIIDDEFGNWLRALPTANVVVYLDNCNSGTGTREVTPFTRIRRLKRDLSKLPKPPGVARRAIADQPDRSGFDPEAGKVLELSAAQPDQAAVDAYFPAHDGAPAFHGGAFTTFLVRQLWQAPPTATYEDVFRGVREALKRNRFEQDPYISEDVPMKSAPVFYMKGAKPATSEAALPVMAMRGGRAELGGGEALGVTNGSVFTTSDGARLVVDSLTPERATARILSGSVRKGERARLAGYRFPATPLLVNVGGLGSSTVHALSGSLGHAAGVRLVADPNAFSDLLLRRSGDSVRVVGLDGAVRARFAAGEAGAAALTRHLRKEAAAKRLGDMDNLAQPFGVKVWLDNGKSELGLGQTVTFHAQADRDGYLTLVDLGTDGKVTVLFPNPYESDNRVRKGQTYTFPTPAMDFQIEVQPPAGRGLVRAFLTRKPLDLPTNGKNLTSGDVTLAEKITDAVEDAAGRVEGSPDAVRLDTWGTASLVYTIKP